MSSVRRMKQLYMLQSWMNFRNIMLSEKSQGKKDHIFYGSIYIIYPQKVNLWIWEVAAMKLKDAYSLEGKL